jgi:hypothetical protein
VAYPDKHPSEKQQEKSTAMTNDHHIRVAEEQMMRARKMTETARDMIDRAMKMRAEAHLSFS